MPPKYKYADTLLKIDHISLSYDDKVILRDVNAEIRDIIRDDFTQGQVVGFLRPSSIAKPQLFLIIARPTQPTSGHFPLGPQHAPPQPATTCFVPPHDP